MPRYRFPDLKGVPAEQTPEGLVALGGDLSPENLMEAYRKGIFPWPVGPASAATPITWFSPIRRAILEFGSLHLPKSLKKSLKQARQPGSLVFTIDRGFDEVIQACAEAPRPGQDGTWITESMLKGYRDLHRAGHAHSIEAWRGETLVGGVYGVDVDGAFAGESMFHRESDASKLALLFLARHLSERGLDWMDIQMLTPHLVRLGAVEISRDEYLGKLAATRARGLRLF